MKHAVILAHPAHKSLNAEIARAYVEPIERLGHDVLVRDLYRMRFDPLSEGRRNPRPQGSQVPR